MTYEILTPTAPALFDFQGHSVRAMPAPDGSHWFVASDITKALGYRDALTGVRTLDADETATHILRIRSVDGTTQAREVLTVNESGLYSLILRSRKPAAKAFKRWVTAEVLPSLRREGFFIAGQSSRARIEDMNAEELRAYVVNSEAAATRLAELNAEAQAAYRARMREHRDDRDEAFRLMRRRR
ncbi:MAG: Bro-N domain-containing protein [Leptothrix sp. (in: b-proteobacteria)]